MGNKKIHNATPNEYNGIRFKSQAETRIYKALVNLGIKPDYESYTFVLSPKVRPTVVFYNRTDGKGFHQITEPISKITYTPDFTFTYNGIFVIIEVKGIENEVFPIKKNLFRKYLETLPQPVMYFEIRSKKELEESLNIVKMENQVLQRIRKLIPYLPEKDIPIGNKYLTDRNFDALLDLVDSVIVKVKKERRKKSVRYSDVDLPSLQTLSVLIMTYKDNLE